jgi:4'-phosphopantetheinyl transferase EntD
VKRINLAFDGAHRFVTSWVNISELFLSTDPSALDFLSSEETKIFNGYGVEKRRREYLAGRAATKLGLQALANSNLPCLFKGASILNGSDRAPYFICACREPHPFSFSLSHAHNLASAYLTDQSKVQLGIDVVWKEERDPRKLRDFLAISEIELIFQYPAERQSNVTNIIWAAKESVSKALKVGMAAVSSIIVRGIDDLDHIEIELNGKSLATNQALKGQRINCRVEEQPDYWTALATLWAA